MEEIGTVRARHPALPVLVGGGVCQPGEWAHEGGVTVVEDVGDVVGALEGVL